jgi:alpha-glucosidase
MKAGWLNKIDLGNSGFIFKFDIFKQQAMNSIKKVFFLISIFCVFNKCGIQDSNSDSISVNSPDRKIRAEIYKDADSKLLYKVEATGKEIITASRLGIVSDSIDLGSNIRFGSVKSGRIDEIYSVFGVHNEAVNRCNTKTVEIQTEGENWFLDIRAYDDGVAVRSRLAAKANRHIQGEATEWKVPSKTLYWYQTDLVSYEGTFEKVMVDTLASDQIIGLPVTALLPAGNYALLTEASLMDYSDLAVKTSGEGTLKAFFHAEEEGWTTNEEVIQPWRVTLIANDLNSLVNSDLIRNLCPPPSSELVNANWIKPGRVAWNWWSTPRLVYDQQHQWVDWAKQLGFEYYLIDAGWTRWQEDNMNAWDGLTEVVSYAKSVGVDIWIWLHSREVSNEADRTRIFENAVKTGVSGLKIDFVPKCTHEWSNWYEATLKDAAKNKLMVDFHGAVKPTGRERTWPNELTREAIRGHEYHIKRYKRILEPDHDCVVPFNRFVQGFADYTPTVFNPSELLGYTWSREIAQAIVFTSPFLCYADHPENYLKNPAINIIKAIPSTWDETIVLQDSEIGKCAAFARRSGNAWFIGIINGDKSKNIDIPLSFLPAGTYTLIAYEDDPDRDDGIIQHVSTVSQSDSIKLTIRPKGGFVAELTKR